MSQALKQWYLSGLQALTAANRIGKEGAEEGAYHSRNEEVAELARSSTEMQERHAATIARLLQATGEEASGQDNPAMSGIRQTVDQMIDHADEEVKDAASLAGAQLGFHYYIAAYGSLASDARHVGEDAAAEEIETLLAEVKTQDERYTDVAEGLANKQAASA